MFPSGIALPPAVFSPLIDMSSTQALVTLARAAKEAEIQNLLKGPTKRPNINTTPPNNISQISTTTPSNSRFPLHTFPISNLNQQHPSHISPKSPASNNQSSSSEQATMSTSPLDLSANTPVTKRVKLDAHSPNRSIGSPTHQRSLSSGGSCRTVSQRKCQSQSVEINSWNVSQVCEFVSSIDICAEYVEVRFWAINTTGKLLEIIIKREGHLLMTFLLQTLIWTFPLIMSSKNDFDSMSISHKSWPPYRYPIVMWRN